jgi:hypothetical protein
VIICKHSGSFSEKSLKLKHIGKLNVYEVQYPNPITQSHRKESIEQCDAMERVLGEIWGTRFTLTKLVFLGLSSLIYEIWYIILDSDSSSELP